VAGGVLGAALLLILPASAFKAIVPVFIAIAVVPHPRRTGPPVHGGPSTPVRGSDRQDRALSDGGRAVGERLSRTARRLL
jgi:hypothetical protein